MKVSKQLWCPCCNNKNFTEVVKLDKNRFDSFIKLSEIKYSGKISNFAFSNIPIILKCSDCNHYWYKVYPSDKFLKTMYDNKRSLTESDSSINPYIYKEIKKLKKFFTKSNPKFLDYGSGYGKWSYAANQEGFNVTSYEPSLERSNKFGNAFHNVSSLKTLEDQKFDLINLEQVLEHVSNLDIFLKNIKKYMSTSTILRITVPNMEKYNSKDTWLSWPFDGSKIHIMSPYEHLHGFNYDSLRNLIERNGFKQLKINLINKYSPYYLIRKILSKFFISLRTTKLFVQLK